MSSPIIFLLVALAVVIVGVVIIPLAIGIIALGSDKKGKKTNAETKTTSRPTKEYYEGTELEQRTFCRIYYRLSPGDYLITNTLVPFNSGKKTEVDAIIVSTKGVFVIEIKNMRGSVRGNEEDEYWHQESIHNSLDFKNPIKQNHNHCTAVHEALGNDMTVYNVVIFDGLDYECIDAWGRLCFNVSDFFDVYYRVKDKLSKEDVARIANQLHKYRATVQEMFEYQMHLKEEKAENGEPEHRQYRRTSDHSWRFNGDLGGFNDDELEDELKERKRRRREEEEEEERRREEEEEEERERQEEQRRREEEEYRRQEEEREEEEERRRQEEERERQEEEERRRQEEEEDYRRRLEEEGW